MYIDKLVPIVNKYNSIYHKKIKMKPLVKKLMIKILNLKFDDFLECQNIKLFLQKATLLWRIFCE